ncbi:DUF2207 family protein [Gryllotalpicola protaetiae]|uniref:DUF2207 domain-containing protein n=1 Tax=Gryllotalpicola protaetiae TaxID=2419771 RepID=A0A387BRP8_9MICO|nr:DUF2207 domain-containing protein [Gryllotalpicola protaetiae]AYG03729.1 DUF2207 domain-containing protein [Gryllotalpicola protaetiae]
MIQRWGIRILLALLFGALASGGLVAAAPAQASVRSGRVVSAGTAEFTFDSLHTDYRLTRTADHRANLAVTETFVARFPDFDQNHGIERAIPTTADGRSLHVQIRGVTDAAGAAVPYQIQTDNSPAGFRVLRIGDPYAYAHGVQTYVIAYTMRDVIHEASGGGQQFLFDVNGTGWGQPFGTVSATLHVPAGLTGALTGDNHCYAGARGATGGDCDISASGGTVAASASNLAAGHNLTMSVGFKPGTFEVPVSVARVLVWVLLGIAIVVFALALVVRIVSLGNPKGTGIIVAQYQAFPGIGVMEAAELLDERDRAFPALMTQLVVSRAATMIRDDRGTKKTSDDLYSLTLHDATVLDDEDADAVHTLFGSIKPDAAVTLDPKEPKIGDRIAKLLREARDSVRKQGLIGRVHTPLSVLLLVIAFFALFAAVAGAVLLNALAFGTWLHTLALVLAAVLAIAALALVWPRERRTAAAVPAYEHLLGIRDYLRLAEADRIRMLQSPSGAETATPQGAPDNTVVVKLYEKLLPYAILFNIEKEWREVLGRYWATTPTEVSPTLLPLQALLFANAFASHNYATTASTQSGSHSWSGSGGGGFSGGFSGGGFGGGGGGGW